MRTLLFTALFVTKLCWADAPMDEPTLIKSCPKTSSACAISDPAKSNTVVTDRETGKELWHLEEWNRWCFQSARGNFLAVGYAGMNLIPKDASLEEIMFRVYERGNLVRSIRLSDLYSSIAELPETSSHRVWLKSAGFDGDDEFKIELINEKKKTFKFGK